jgi:hypothetical protein
MWLLLLLLLLPLMLSLSLSLLPGADVLVAVAWMLASAGTSVGSDSTPTAPEMWPTAIAEAVHQPTLTTPTRKSNGVGASGVAASTTTAGWMAARLAATSSHEKVAVTRSDGSCTTVTLPRQSTMTAELPVGETAISKTVDHQRGTEGAVAARSVTAAEATSSTKGDSSTNRKARTCTWLADGAEPAAAPAMSKSPFPATAAATVMAPTAPK